MTGYVSERAEISAAESTTVNKEHTHTHTHTHLKLSCVYRVAQLK